MSIVKYAAEFTLLAIVVVMFVIGVLTVTHGTPVRNVISPGGDNAPPAVSDSLLGQTMELYTGMHLGGGNAVAMVVERA